MSLDNKVAFNMCTGGVAGVLSRTVVSPLERLKILYQVQFMTLEKAGGGPRKYNGVFQSLGLILKEEGVRGFYKGNGANAVRVFPYIGVQFAAFGYLSDLVKVYKYDSRMECKLSPVDKLLTGAVAGMVSVLATYPLDNVRGRLSAQGGALHSQYTGMLDCLTSTVRAEGLRGLFAGISPTLLGIGPYVGVNFLVYETLKEHAPVPEGETGPSALHLALCGGVAGTTGQTVAYPLDLLRRRFQLQTAAGNPMYNSVGHAVKRIVSEEGISGLYKGYLPNFIKTWPTIAIMFWSKDMLARNEFLRKAFGLAT
jgi:solute carrier family 25 phosphate transporter 23/24/25/41